MKKKFTFSVNYGVIAVVFFLVSWSIAAHTGAIDTLYVGTPSNVVLELVKYLRSEAFLGNFLNSAQAFLVGYSLALVLGGLIGLILGVNKNLYQTFSPFIFLFNAIPYIAILPLLVIWFGLGITSKTVIVFLMVVSPMIIYTLDSVKTTDVKLLAMAKSFGANKISIFKQIYLPHSLPYMFSAARVGVGRGLTAIVVSEVFGLGKGIAYDIPYYGATYQTDRLMAAVLLILLLNLILINIIRRIRTKVVFWENFN